MNSNFLRRNGIVGHVGVWHSCAVQITSLLFIVASASQAAPSILTQPQSQNAVTGTNVTLSVKVRAESSPSLPAVGSGTLQLWLAADMGVLAGGSGTVSNWSDLSGHTNNAVQSNTNLQPLLVNPAAIGGRAAIRFNGVQTPSAGDYLQASGQVQIPNAMTAFTVYMASSLPDTLGVMWVAGAPQDQGGCRGAEFYTNDIGFTFFSYDYPSSMTIPTNSYRICIDQLNTNLSSIQISDLTATTSTNETIATSGAKAPQPGYYVGGYNPSQFQGLNFAGDVAEVIVYQGALSNSDLLAVQAYLEQKYFQIGDTNITYQWLFNATNIVGATNASLTLTNVQTAEAGSYSVIVNDLTGPTNSSNAVLNVTLPPPCAPAPSGLVGWWPAEDNAIDIAGGNNGFLSNGVSFEPGEVGQAFVFNGVNQYVRIPDSPSLRPSSLTIEGWFNWQPADGRVMVAKPYGTGTEDSFALWHASGQLNASVVTTSGAQAWLSFNWSPTTGTWHHVAYTFDANAHLQSLYVDGTFAASSLAQGAIVYDSNPLQFGADIENGQPAYFFGGSIDEVSLYNRALTPTEIGAIYNASSTGKCGVPPTILVQPQSQNVVVGTNVTFSVSAANGASQLPSISSGTLNLWLKADAGVVANGTGQVSQWHDQSGNTNDASQINTNEQPMLAYPAALGGRAVVRFNGIQDNVHGDYLQGTKSVGIPNAYTSFLFYELNSDAPTEQVADLVGVPVTFGGSRSDYILSGDLATATWSYDYNTSFLIPTNSYRIWNDRFDTNLSQIEFFDITASTATNFSIATSGQSAPAPGYYVGGLDPNVQNVSRGRNFGGDIAEWIVYKGDLTESDRLLVVNYLQQKYYATSGAGSLSYQWQFDGTNINGATNASLILTSVSTNDAGTYSVIVSNLAGFVTSSNTTLAVGYSPSISTQPQSQQANAGTNISFTVSASGTGTLGYQWYFNGAAVATATNSTISLNNIQVGNGGTYSVSISNLFGVIISSNALLTVVIPPFIATQPQSQSIVESGTVTFSVNGNFALPSVNSGTLQLWLKADVGVVTNSAGQVNQWHDQSGNTNDASQINTNEQPLLTYPAALGGRAVVRFNGIQDNVHGDYLQGTNSVGIPSAYTSFLFYELNSDAPAEQVADLVGVPGNYGASRSDYVLYGDLATATWAYDYDTGFVIPTNSYRIWNDRFNTNLTQIEFFDITATTATNFSIATSGQATPAPGYYVGGLDPNVPNVSAGRNFGGDIAEWIVYQGDLTEPDRLAVVNYLEQKYYQAAPVSTVTYQWLFDGTNIVGATNASLVLTNVQEGAVGTYSVILSNAAGSVTSSNAILTLHFPAAITSSASNQVVSAGSSVTFNAAASGTAPVFVQWQFNGTNIGGATNSSLTLTNVLEANAGSYTMVATNAYGTATSSPAILTVNETTVQVVSTSVAGGGTVVVSIDLDAVGTEYAAGFTLNFDPSVLTYQGVALGSGAAGNALAYNAEAGAGLLGVNLYLFSGTFPAGTNDILDVTFQAATVTNTTATSITFGSQIADEVVSDPGANRLPTIYVPGSVTISPAVLEGDVSPRPNGDEALNTLDWVQEGRFVAGLDTVSNGSEFQRADCAPRSTLGDGQITVADWVQVGRYSVKLDTATASGGPTSPVSPSAVLGSPIKASLSRPVLLAPLLQGSLTNSVSVELVAQGNESALSFSVSFDPAVVHFVNASLGSGAGSAALIQNTTKASNGTLGFVIGFSPTTPPTTFAAGTQSIVNLKFAAASYSNNAVLVFGNSPVLCQLVDSNANVLSANFQNVTLPIGGAPWPILGMNPSGGNLVLSWPSLATPLSLQTASSLGAEWSNVLEIPASNSGSLAITSSVSTNSAFFRLKY